MLPWPGGELAGRIGGAPIAAHEYSLQLRADPDGIVTSVTVRQHALPWRECDTVPAGAGVVVGARIGELEPVVRTELAGVNGCTHLNDSLRGLDAVPYLLELLDPTGATP